MNTEWADRLGGVASSTCALHCLTMSLAPAVLATLGELNERLEWGFFALAILFGLAGAGLALRRHGMHWLLGAFGLSIATLTLARFGEAWSLFEGAGVVAITGGLLLAGSHLLSIREARRCCAPELQHG